MSSNYYGSCFSLLKQEILLWLEQHAVGTSKDNLHILNLQKGTENSILGQSPWGASS